jgi:hypothetical protein
MRFVAEADYDRTRLVALVTEIGRFHITERRMRRAQIEMTAALARERPLASRKVRAYVKAVARYFGGFEREARVHLADLDRRLGRVSQLQYNLSAERGVAERRVEATQGVLSRIKELAPQ